MDDWNKDGCKYDKGFGVKVTVDGSAPSSGYINNDTYSLVHDVLVSFFFLSICTFINM